MLDADLYSANKQPDCFLGFEDLVCRHTKMLSDLQLVILHLFCSVCRYFL